MLFTHFNVIVFIFFLFKVFKFSMIFNFEGLEKYFSFAMYRSIVLVQSVLAKFKNH